MHNLALISIILYASVVKTDNAKILGIFYMPSLSHQRVFQPIWKELSLRGHEVTILTTNPLNDPALTNLTEVDLSFAYNIIFKHSLQTALFKNAARTNVVKHLYRMASEVISAQLDHPVVQKLLQDTSRSFDAVLVEIPAPPLYAIGKKFSCPVIGVSSTDFITTTYDALGNPFDAVSQTSFDLICLDSLNLLQKLYCVYFDVWLRYYYHSHVLPDQKDVAKTYISSTLQNLWDMEKDISMVFSGIHPILRSIKSNVPLITALEGIHLQENIALPQDLQYELDTAPYGAVYFSLGSNVRSASLPIEMRTQIIQTFIELPYKVFWKWEDDVLPDQPINVVIRKWFPQQGILGHPNLKVFVTQGGLQSMEEAISNSVPFVGMPFFGDQTLNVIKIVNLKMGLFIDPERLTKDALKASIIEVAENKTYRNNVKMVRSLMFDTPMKALDKAMWWTEYVIRHNGTKHLRSPVLDLSWFSYFLLDVICFITISIAIVIFITYKIIRFSVQFAWKLW